MNQRLDDFTLAGVPGAGSSAGRIRDGVDTDSNCADFVIQTPTPGAPNKAAP